MFAGNSIVSGLISPSGFNIYLPYEDTRPFRRTIRRAATIKEQIERLSKELSIIFGLSANSPAVPRKSGMTVSARKKIAAAQRARWANLRRAKPAISSAKPAAKAKKKTMSQAARRKLSAKLKAYWAQKKARQK